MSLIVRGALSGKNRRGENGTYLGVDTKNVVNLKKKRLQYRILDVYELGEVENINGK